MIKAIADVKAAAVFDNIKIKQRAKETLEEIKCFTTQYLPDFQPVVNYQINKLTKATAMPKLSAENLAKLI